MFRLIRIIIWHHRLKPLKRVYIMQYTIFSFTKTLLIFGYLLKQ